MRPHDRKDKSLLASTTFATPIHETILTLVNVLLLTFIIHLFVQSNDDLAPGLRRTD